MTFLIDLPDTPFPPLRIHLTGDAVIVVGVDGELARLDPQTLQASSVSVKPFPSSIQHSVVAEGKFIATWTEYELQIARMAALSLSEPFQEGVSRSDLRVALRGGKQVSQSEVSRTEFDDVGDTIGGAIGGTIQGSEAAGDVAGAEWSHALEAEPLGMTSDGERIAFCMYSRGIYCTSPSSEEFWRQPLVEWLELNELPDGSHIVCMTCGPDPEDLTLERIWLWSEGGGWAYYSWENGDLLAQGTLEAEITIESAWANEHGEWLLSSPPQTVIRWKPGGDIETASVQGPVNFARWEDDGWSMAGWREDIRWWKGDLTNGPRSDIGVALYSHPKLGTLVLDNTGKWSPFNAEKSN